MTDELDETVAGVPGFGTLEPRQARLVVVRGSKLGEVHLIIGPELVIGRASDASLRIHDDGISRSHCRLRQDTTAVTIEDLASRNGTYCNGERLGTTPRVLTEGDLLQIGTTVLVRFTYMDESALGKEVAIAKQIQASILPRRLEVEGLEIAASMVPAAEVSGDYYDIIPVRGGCWLGIGDVSGHGMGAGMIMLMIQSAVASLVRSRPDAAPRDILRALNELLYDNIRQRLRHQEHVTLTLLRFTVDGRLQFVGAHEEIVLWRAAAGRCERVVTPGTWLGIGRNIDHALIESTIELSPGDLVVLYTDGVVEAMSPARVQFGLPRLEAVIERCRDRPIDEIDREIQAELARWTKLQEDDATVVVLRYRGA